MLRRVEVLEFPPQEVFFETVTERVAQLFVRMIVTPLHQPAEGAEEAPSLAG